MDRHGLRAADIVTGTGSLASAFAVTDLAVAVLGHLGHAIADLAALDASASARPAVTVDRVLASGWFATSLRPDGWSLPPVWDPVAGDYPTADGWIRLHTNAPHHRRAALAALGVDDATADRDRVAAAVARWDGEALEDAVVAAGGCAAKQRTRHEWRIHPQGAAVMSEPLIATTTHTRTTHTGAGHTTTGAEAAGGAWQGTRARPLAGVRVLDLTRVLAGPVATRTLAGFGADVLRIDPPGWDEPAVVPDVTLGKRCARLDARTDGGRAALARLLAGADVLVHGYRPGAIDGIGLDAVQRRALRPGLVEVCLDAYGWTGPWCGRRGFDSLVQMSSGIAAAGAEWAGTSRPTPLPVQAVDHATGYLMAAAAIDGLRTRLTTGDGSTARCSLARTAALLMELPPSHAPQPHDTDAPLAPHSEATPWGPARRLAPPLHIEGTPLRWDRPAASLGAHSATWVSRPPR